MRAGVGSARLGGMKTLIAAVVLLAVLPATASAGTITGKIPRKGKAMTVRVVRLDTAQVVAAKRVSTRRYRVKAPRGRYVVMATAGNRRFTSHTIRVGRKGTRRAKLAATADPPLAIVAVDPNIKLVGADKIGGPHALAIDSMVITDLLQNGCANGGKFAVVEVRHKDLIEKEIELQHSGGFDPGTIVTPHFLTPDTFISGRGEVVGDHITVELTMRGKVNGSSTVSVPLNRPFDMTDGPASALVGEICRSKDAPPPPPPPPAAGPALGYRGSLSGSATITSAAGVTTETWSSSDVRFEPHVSLLRLRPELPDQRGPAAVLGIGNGRRLHVRGLGLAPARHGRRRRGEHARPRARRQLLRGRVPERVDRRHVHVPGQRPVHGRLSRHERVPAHEPARRAPAAEPERDDQRHLVGHQWGRGLKWTWAPAAPALASRARQTARA